MSDQYVEKSAHANVFKFNRKKKRFERAKVNSRCFHWFPLKLCTEFCQIILNLCKTTDLKIACLLNLVVGVVKVPMT